MTTVNLRDTARTWLAAVLHAKDCDGPDGKAPHPHAYYLGLAGAILNTPGVQVEVDQIRRFPQEVGDDEPMEVRNPRHMRVTHSQVVIRLPAQPIEVSP